MPETTSVEYRRVRKQGVNAVAGTPRRLNLGLGVTVRTIFVGFPTPAVVQLLTPFHASGTNDPATAMDPTARLITPNGTLIGNLLQNPDPPFTWTYEFTDPIPTGVPLALVVTGTDGQNNSEEIIVPFEGE
jgi:hypothetical protein